jgi:ligand-binding sensor domain-containing protein/signal transduction histidine kinase
MWRRFRLATLASLAFASLLAAAPRPESSQYSYDRWGRENGFSWGAANAIAQSPDGYLWIATEHGLVRFDGYTFRLYAAAGPALKMDDVRQLYTDNQGTLWILLATTQLLRYRDGRFEAARDEAQFGINAIGHRQDGTPLFSSSSFGPLTFSDGNYERLAANDSPAVPGPLLQRDDTLSSRLSWATGVMPHRYVQTDSPAASIAETSDRTLWLGTRDGLFSLTPGQSLQQGKSVSKTPVNCLLALKRGELWIGTDHGVLRWDGRQLTNAGLSPSLSNAKITAMMLDRDGNRWLVTSNGLFRTTAEDKEESLSDENTLAALHEDREGDIWVGSHSGLERLREKVFRTISPPENARSGGPIYVDDTNRLWFAPLDGGLHWFQGQQIGSVVEDGLDRDVVYSIAGRGSELWIGRQRGGLTYLNFAGGSLRTKTYTRKDGLAQDSVYAVYETQDGTVWAGTLNAGVSKLSRSSFTTYTTANGLSSNSVLAIAERPDGSVWFATPDGLSELAAGHWRVFKTADGLPSSEISCLFTDSTGTLWIGTKAGLAILQSAAIQVPANLPKALQEQTLGIAEGKRGGLWVTTANHIVRADRAKLAAGTVRDADLREFGADDGLPGTEGVKRSPSLLTDSRGQIWVSTNRGISVVDPKHALRPAAPAMVHIDGVTADGTPLDPSALAMFNDKPRRVTFAFTGISLAAPDRVRYKYKLEGADERWSEPVRERQVTYGNLGSGSYRFVVASTDSQGVWNSDESAFQFRIAPAFWETWWFRVATIAVLALTAFVIYRLRMRAFARRTNLRFEERLAERTRIAQELHDTLLQGFLSASMQLHVIADQLPADSPAHSSLHRVLGLIGRVIEEGRNAVRGLRTTERDNRDLGEELSRIRAQFPQQDAVEFRVVVEGTPRALHPVIRDEIYRIGHEALTNAFRHSQADSIEAELEYAADGLRLVVRDSGIGLDSKEPERKADSHWGLTGMRERAKKIGASFKILSRIGTGTEVDLWVPGQIAFLPSAGKSRASWLAGIFGRRNGQSHDEEHHE